MKREPPSLAAYRAIADWVPHHADFIIWHQGWLIVTVKYGVVSDYDQNSGVVSIILENTPQLLFTMTTEEMAPKTYLFKAQDICSFKRGRWYIGQNNGQNTVWYI